MIMRLQKNDRFAVITEMLKGREGRAERIIHKRMELYKMYK